MKLQVQREKKICKVNNEEIPCLSERVGKNMDFVDKDSVSVVLSEQRSPLLGKVCSGSIAEKVRMLCYHLASGNVLGVESKTEKANNLKTERHVEQSGKQGTDMSSFVSKQHGQYVDEKSERKQVVGHHYLVGFLIVKEYNKFLILLINEAAAPLAKSGKIGALNLPFQGHPFYTHSFHVRNFSCYP